MTEKEFQDQVLTLAGYCGWMAYHTYDSRRSHAGFPDLVLVRPPRLLFVELKSSKGRISPAQQVWLRSLEACEGIEVYLWRPEHWEEIASTLAKTRPSPPLVS